MTRHAHKWNEWDSRFVPGNYEKRSCECGAFQMRPCRHKKERGV